MLNLRNVGDSKFTAHHTVLVEMCLRLKPTGFSPWVVHLSSIDSPYSYTLQFLSFSDRMRCWDLFRSAVGIEDDDSSDMCKHTPYRIGAMNLFNLGLNWIKEQTENIDGISINVGVQSITPRCNDSQSSIGKKRSRV